MFSRYEIFQISRGAGRCLGGAGLVMRASSDVRNLNLKTALFYVEFEMLDSKFRAKILNLNLNSVRNILMYPRFVPEMKKF